MEVVTDYLEGTMAPRQRERFEAHLTGCPHCQEYLAQMRHTLEVLGRIEPDNLPPGAEEELVALFRRWTG